MGTLAVLRRPLRPAGLFTALITLALLLSALGGATPRPTAVAPLAPALAQRIADDSALPIALIVRAAGPTEQLGALVRGMGGQVRSQFAFINAIAVSLPAGKVAALAAHPLVRSVSYDAPLEDTQAGPAPINTAALRVAYNHAIGAPSLWNRPGTSLRGDGVTVAVVDSGVNPQQDLYSATGQNRLLASVAFQPGWDTSPTDTYGHGDHVAGIIAGNGSRSGGAYVGVAPNANLVNVRVLDKDGAGTVASMIQGLEWIYNNQQAYSIRIVNISVNSSEWEAVDSSPLSAAVQALWFSGIVVVVSAGNSGEEALFPPANDPFVITVGASDDRGTWSVLDDTMTGFSAFGRTVEGYAKPDLVAPGRNIVSLMAMPNTTLAQTYPAHVVEGTYFRMSGTSMAAPIVAGATALLLQSEPNLTPDEVKFRLMATARPISTRARAGAGQINIFAAVLNLDRVSGRANQGAPVSDLLVYGDDGIDNPNLFWGITGGNVSWRGKGTAFFSSVSWRGKTGGTGATTYWGP